MDITKPRAADIFRGLVQDGFITPVEQMDNMRLPGELLSVPTFVSYSTPEIPIHPKVKIDAKLG